MRKYSLWMVTAALAMVLVAQTYLAGIPGAITVGRAAWAFEPQNFAEAAARAQSIVEAQVVSVQRGPDLVVAASGEPTGQDVIPTERVTVRVVASDKGAANAGQEVTLFRTGSAGNVPPPPPESARNVPHPDTTERGQSQQGSKPAPESPAPERPAPLTDPDLPPPATGVFVMEDDPTYTPGETYYLLLEPGPDGTMRPVSPEGRYRVAGDGRLQAVGSSAVAQSVAGRTLAEARDAATGRANIPTQPGVQRRVTTPGMPTTGSPIADGLLVATVVGLAWLTIGFVLSRRRA